LSKSGPRKKVSRRRRDEPAWADWSDEELLDLRLCDLGVRIQGTWLEEMVARLHEEMARKALRLRPHVWLSNEWFSPDGIPGIAIPFYLAHPRLMRLERRQMFQVEGGTRSWCMKILRHEAGHAFDTAYRLRRTRRWQQTFGRAGRRYPTSYRARPESRKHVLHLEWWYAQSHPVEDFAETFAVWLAPGSRWRSTYKGWPVLRKLEYVQAICTELADVPPPVRTRQQSDPLRSLKRTLRRHYRERRRRYGVDLPDFYELQLQRIFAPGRASRRESAAAFLRRVGPDLRRRVVRTTGAHPYTVDQFLNDMMARARKLGLRRSRAERDVKLEAAILLAAQVMGYVSGGGHHVAL
jgi:hypothetical protein